LINFLDLIDYLICWILLMNGKKILKKSWKLGYLIFQMNLKKHDYWNFLKISTWKKIG
jgi:hypothetical protein